MPDSREHGPTASIALPRRSCGLQLHRVQGERLIACEPMQFERGWMGVETVLRRAAISGRVEIGVACGDYFADIQDKHGDLLETVSLDRGSYRALKYHWMRCKVLKP